MIILIALADMKKILFILSIFLISCSRNFETIEQTGIIVDVEYTPSYQSVQVLPFIAAGKITTMQTIIINHPEEWKAHIHYCDSICVYEYFSYEVHQGDTVKRTIKQYKKD